MTAARIALATAAEFPDLDDDGPVLLAALAGRGLTAEPAVWTDPDVDWPAYDLVVVRCTWDYHERRADFLDWARRVAAVTTLANSADVLAWNTDKTYLRTLREAGLPVVPTDWLEPGDVFVVPEVGEYVVKPAVSAGARDTNRYRVGDHDERAVAHATDLLGSGRTVMVQPYLSQVDTHGETALFFFAGVFSHAVRKGPLLTPGMELVAGAYAPETIEPREPSAAERDAAEQVLDALAAVAPAAREDLVYARVDLVPGADGSPTLLELELTEPSMFLINDGTGGDRFGGPVRGGDAGGRGWLTSPWCWGSRPPATRRGSAWSAATRCSPTRWRPASTSTPGSAAWCRRWPAGRTSRRWCRRSSVPAPRPASAWPTSTRWPSPAGRA